MAPRHHLFTLGGRERERECLRVCAVDSNGSGVTSLKRYLKKKVNFTACLSTIYHGSVLLYVTVPLLPSESTISSLVIKL